ncbi:MAG: mediator complex subunit, partial [Tremellales sp. Tagirdzhanova-0007]
MTVSDLPLPELVGRAYARAVPARKFVKLVQSWHKNRHISANLAAHEIADALLHELATVDPPALLLAYLSQAIASTLLDSRTFVIHLLFFLVERDSPSITFLASISSVVLANPTGLEPSDPLPSTVDNPSTASISVSAPVTSASPGPALVPSSTLALLLPLLHLCSFTNPSPPPTPILDLTIRLLSLLEPYPAPSLNVGLEVGGLLQSLPEKLAAPLRHCLSGLMADIAFSQDTIRTQPSSSRPDLPNLTARDSSPPSSGSTLMPLPQSLTFLLTYVHLSTRWTRHPAYGVEPSQPPANHIHLIRLGPHVAPDPSTFLSQLIQAAVKQWAESYDGDSCDGVSSWLFLTEALPVLLSWWKENADPHWLFPDTLSQALSAAFETSSVRIAEGSAWISAGCDSSAAHTDDEDDPSAFIPPDGWSLYSMAVTIIHRFLQLRLLEQDDGKTILSNASLPPATSGESLMFRLASVPRGHLDHLAHLIAFAPGAARSFNAEVIDCIRSYPSTSPLDGLLSKIASNPTLITLLTTILPAAELLEILNTQLLELTEERLDMLDDPQGSFVKFGDGVILVEAVVAQYRLPLPNMLQDSRRALTPADLDPPRKLNLNGWIKALFGSDGIDDETLRATPPNEFSRLASGLIQQAISATAAGIIDLDTLHNGLSYFSHSLLSWSLGGVVAWLCYEVERNGSLSALHLDVLQTLLLGSFPAPLLRVTGSAIDAIIDSSSGLGPVIQSSRFDVAG